MNDKSNPTPRKRGPSLKWTNLSVRFKLVTIILVAVLVSVAAVAALNIYNTGHELTKNTGASLTELAKAAGHDVAALLVDRVTGMQSLAAEGEFQDDMAEQNAAYSGGTDSILAELTALDKQWSAAADDDPLVKARLDSTFAYELEEVKDLIPDFVEVFATDRYGGLAATSDRTSDYYQADEEWWQAAYNNGQGAVYIAPPAVDESTGVTSINIAVPVYAENGQVIGILRATLDVATLLNRLGNIQVGETGRADMIIGDTLFDIHHEEHTGEVEKELDAAALAEIKSSSAGFLQTPFAGQPSLVGYAAISSLSGEEYITDLDWYTILYQTESEALAAVGQQARTSLIIAAIVATLAILAGVGMGQLIANPIALLRDMVVQFTTGNLDARVDIQSEDEIGTLATNFNQMAEQVGGLLNTVQTRSVELEERTRELEASQRVTFAASEHATPDEMLDLVVNLIRDQFDLYHAQVYMVDEAQQTAVLRQSTGYAGRQLLQRKHSIPLDATALVTRVIHTGEAVLVDDVKADPNFLPNPLLPDTRSELVVPLKREGQVIGVMDAQDRNPGRFNPSTTALFQTMADQVTILFENSELLQRVTDQTEVLGIFTSQLRTAADIARRLGTILDPGQLLEEVVELIQSRFGLYHAHIYLMDEDENTLKLATGSGEVGRVLRERGHSISLDAEKSLVARAARTRGAILVVDTTLASDFMPNPLLPQTRSELSIPLVVGNTLLGVLDLQDDQAGRFTEAERDTFGTLAGLVATAIQNARLFEAQRQAEAAIRASQQRLSLLVQQSPLAVIEWNTNFEVVQWNEAAEQIFGYTRAEALGRHAAGLIVPEEVRDLVNQVWQDLLTQKGGTRSTNDNFTKDGRFITCEWYNAPLVDVNGNVLGVASLVADITERKQAEQRARDTQQLLQSFLDNFPDIAFAKDTEGRVILGNKALHAFFPTPDGELLGKTVYDLVPTEMADGIWQSEKKLLATGEITEFEEVVPQQGVLHTKLTTKFPLYDAEGNITALGGVSIDITERKQAEAERERLSTVLSNSQDFIGMVDMAGNTIYVNPAGLHMCGYENLEAVLGKPIASFHIPEDAQRLAETVIPVVLETGSSRVENRLLRTDGTLIPVDQTLFVIHDAQGNPQSLATFMTDITERKQAETALRTTRASVEQAQDAFFWFDADARFTDVSDRTCEILGYPREQLLEMRIFDVDPDFPPTAWPGLKAQIKQTGSVTMESHHRTQAGRVFPVEVTVSYLEFGDEEIYFSIARDITERKLAEAEIEKRASELQTVAEVGTAAATILDPDQLLAQVVELTKSNFGLYHAHIYLIDEIGESLLLAAGAGEAGAQMLAQGWQIAADSETSLVARAFRSHEGVIVNDVRAAPDFLPNPLLPDTRSELAVPLIVGERVLGVLDVQSDQVDHFTREDVAIQTTLAGQIATAIQNARLFEAQMQTDALIRRRAEFDRLVAEVSSAFVNVSSAQIDAEIGRTLEQISKFSNVDRSYVFIFSDDGSHMTNTHEWCAPDIAPQIQDLQNMPVTALPWFTERITRPDQVVYLPRVADLPAEAAVEKQIFAEGAIRSLLAVPMIFAGSVAGFMGFDSVRQEREWGEEEINTLKSVGQTMISALQRIRAEAAILQERNFSAAIINSLPGIFYVVDAEANLARWNDRYVAVTGYTPEDLADIGALGPIAEEDRATVAERIQTVFLEGEAEVETHLATKNGERIPYYLTGRRAEIEGQTYVIGMGIDITDRVAAERAVRESQQMLEIVMNNLPESIFWKDKDLVYIGCNTNFAHDAGVDSPEQVIGKTDHDMPWKDQVALYQADDRHVIDTGESKIDYEEPQSTPDGGMIWLRTSKVPLYNEQGEAYAVLGAYADITEMKQAQAEIAKRASELQTVAEVSAAASTILEPDRLLGRVVELTKSNFGLYHAHIYLIDETGESLLLAAGAGEAGAQMLAQGWQIAADSETSLVARAFRSHAGVIVNDVRAAPDFLPNPLLPDTRSELAVPLIVGERVLGVLDVQSDQVDHFTREDVAIQTTLAGQIATAIENARLFQETRQVDRLKSEFLANMSHELRTPLNSIIGYVQLLLMDLEGEIPEDSYEDMKSVETNSQHLLSLINDVLDLARIEAGRMELHMENIDVPNLLDIVKSNNAGLFIDSPLTLSVEAEPDLPQICADQIRITQVLNNLISNAFKFTETGGIIVRAYSVDGEVCIAIEDTGIGIGEKDMDTVFERFRQVDGSFTRRAEGTGLGLSITRLLVELHGGRVTVKSKLGEGSTFTVHLPAAASA